VPLSDEQRSMLQLLLQGQSYEDIGSLLGVGADEVRTRARAALQEVVAFADPLDKVTDPYNRAWRLAWIGSRAPRASPGWAESGGVAVVQAVASTSTVHERRSAACTIRPAISAK